MGRNFSETNNLKNFLPRFEKLVTYKRCNGKYEIDFSKFHNVYHVDTPTLSAKEIDILKVYV